MAPSDREVNTTFGDPPLQLSKSPRPAIANKLTALEIDMRLAMRAD
jgi:hypothetical protein